MSLSLQLGAASELDISSDGDLGKMLHPSLSSIFHIDDLFRSAGNETLAEAPAGALQTSFTTDQEAKWTLDKVNLTLSFKPSATGSITITKSGELLSYNQSGGADDKISITVPEGKAYVAISFSVGLSVAGGVAFSSGNFGVKGSISDSDEFDITNYKCFDAATPLASAVTQAFRTFVLPFKADGIANLNDGDYVDFEFIGKLNLGFGVYYGFSGLLLAGRSGGEIRRSFSNNALGKALFNVKPTFQATAEFSVTYDHDDTFRVVVGRRGQPGSSPN